MSSSNAKILLILLAVLSLGGAYMYVYKGNMEDKDSYDSESESLQVRYDELKAKEEKRPIYEAEIALYSEEVLKIVNKYPTTLKQEELILIVKNFLKENEEGKIDISTITLNQPEEYAAIGGIMDETGTFNSGYMCYAVQFPLPYTGNYTGVKDFVEYIQKNDLKMSISSTSITPNDLENDEYTGNMQTTIYCIAGPGREEAPVEIEDEINNGVDNIFIGGENAKPVEIYTHDYDNGDSIKIANDFQVILNNPNNDLTDGIIVASAADPASQVSDGSNGPVKLAVEVSGKDAELDEEGNEVTPASYTYTYTIGDSSYTGTVSGDDVTIYINSSERVDADDKNSVELSIKNSTSLNVFIKVTGDDPDSPRFSLGSTEGTVKVY